VIEGLFAGRGWIQSLFVRDTVPPVAATTQGTPNATAMLERSIHSQDEEGTGDDARDREVNTVVARSGTASLRATAFWMPMARPRRTILNASTGHDAISGDIISFAWPTFDRCDLWRARLCRSLSRKEGER
jgi:hypothetical protein